MILVFEVNGSDRNVMQPVAECTIHSIYGIAKRIASECDVPVSDVNLRFVPEES